MSFRPVFAALVAAFTLTACSSPRTTITLQNVCEELPKLYCNQSRPCCMKSGFAFDETGCESNYRAWCGVSVAAVSAHKATFNSSTIDECLNDYQPFEDKCLLTGSEFDALSAATRSCLHVFEGTVPPGGLCASDSECAPAASGYVLCASGKCDVQLPSDRVGMSCDLVSCSGQGLVCDATNHCIANPEPSSLETVQTCLGG